MIKLVAFDWNGTLFADTYAIFEADLAVLKSIGQDPIKFSDFVNHFDMPVKNYYQALGVDKNLLEEKMEDMSAVFHEYYETRVAKTRTRANTRTVLSWLKKQKIPTIIISNHIRQRINEQLTRLKLINYFDEILGNTQRAYTMKNKNKKERLLNYLKEKRIKPKETLIIGDTLEEIEIAKEIAALSAAITHGNVSTKRLKKAKPDYLISDLGNLINIIKEINAA